MGGSVIKFRHFGVALVATGAVAIGTSGIAVAQDVSGSVNVSGSSTVEPITSLVAEFFAEENSDVSVRVDGPGTGDGFALFCGGETDISDASRPIDEDEVAECEAAGIEYTELPVGIDGLTIVANKSVKLKCVDHAQIYGLFGPESDGSFATAQTIATELGSTNKPLPASGSVKKFTPGPESGTYDSFIELNYEDIMEERLAAGDVPSDKTGTNDEGEQEVTEPVVSDGQFPNDNAIVQRVEGSKNGLGFFGYAFYVENEGGDLKAIKVADPDTGKCVGPTNKTIQNESYPISRLLYIYPNNAKATESAAVTSFLDFYMTEDNLTTTVKEAGYVPLSKSARQESIDAWKAVASG
jgi:phosphate transport system substrate-binding protein